MWRTGEPDQVDAIRQRKPHDIAYQNAQEKGLSPAI